MFKNHISKGGCLLDIKGAVTSITALKPVINNKDWRLNNSYLSPARIVENAERALTLSAEALFERIEFNNYNSFYEYVDFTAEDNKAVIRKIYLKEGVLKEFLSLKGINVSVETLENLDHVSYWSKDQEMAMYFGGHWLNGDFSVYVGNQFYDWDDPTIYYFDEEEEFIDANQKWFCELYSASSYEEAVKAMSIDMDKIKKAIEEDIKSFEDFLNERIKDSSIDL